MGVEVITIVKEMMEDIVLPVEEGMMVTLILVEGEMVIACVGAIAGTKKHEGTKERRSIVKRIRHQLKVQSSIEPEGIFNFLPVYPKSIVATTQMSIRFTPLGKGANFRIQSSPMATMHRMTPPSSIL